MRKCNKCNKEKELSEFNKNKNNKYGIAYTCKTCMYTLNKQWRKDNKDYNVARNKQWCKENKEKDAARKKSWQISNKDRVIALKAERRARKLNQTPDLTTEDRQQIVNIYKKCRQITRETSIQHHVDHIQPLTKGGLHHPSNLQILTATENRSKYNHWKAEEVREWMIRRY